MTLDEAQFAAGVKFDGRGDGAYYPTSLPAGFPHVFVNLGTGTTVACVGAEIGPSDTIAQTVVTPEGFRLGDTVAQLQAVYGTRARFSPAPPTGLSPRAGYVVDEAGGTLAFYVDSANTRVLGMKGGPGVTPSTCSG